VNDYSGRERYQARRRAVARRRRRALLVGALFALVLGGAAALVLRRPELVPSVVLVPTATPGNTKPTVDLAPTSSAIVAAATPARAATAAVIDPDAPRLPLAQLIDGQRFSYEPNFNVPQIEAYLAQANSPLRDVRFQVGGRVHSFAEVLLAQTSLYSVNPKVVLTVLELQSSAVLQWLVVELYRAQRDAPTATELAYAEGESGPRPEGLSLPEYAIARVLARSVKPGQLGPLLGDGPGSFLATYTRLFEDPRLPVGDLPPPAQPFLVRPTERPFPIASFFDHDTPFLQRNGSLTTYWGIADGDVAYDGHTGWDYAMAAPDVVLAAAAGEVIFAGNNDDGCASPAQAVIIDHANGYRTLYWHLSDVYVTTGQRVAAGEQLGMVGASGCAQGEHLHLQVMYLGRNTDPFGWCGSAPDPWAAHPAGTTSIWLWADRPSPCGSLPYGAVAVDDDSPGFSVVGDAWGSAAPGVGGGTRFAASKLGADAASPWEVADPTLPPAARWQASLPQGGRYRVLAYVPFVGNGAEALPSYAPFRWSSTATTQRVRYVVRHNGGESEVVVDQGLYTNDWADLGTYTFDPGSSPSVALSALGSLRDYGIWADAVVWLPVP
jgi:murein DD-endopeptidase MepM/ murein hydrolase activator NlpD